jgi:hypothetical protein
MGEEVGKIFQKSLEKNGVKFHLEAGVEKAVPSKSDSSKVGGIVLKDGNVLEADCKHIVTLDYRILLTFSSGYPWNGCRSSHSVPEGQ